MMTEKSIDFISGYVFRKMEKSIFDNIYSDSDDSFNDSQFVPKIWFGLTCSGNILNDIKGIQKYALKEILENTLNDLFPKLNIEIVRIIPERQYIRFDYTASKKEERRKMTVAEVEEQLGYKIEIISD